MDGFKSCLVAKVMSPSNTCMSLLCYCYCFYFLLILLLFYFFVVDCLYCGL